MFNVKPVYFISLHFALLCLRRWFCCPLARVAALLHPGPGPRVRASGRQAPRRAPVNLALQQVQTLVVLRVLGTSLAGRIEDAPGPTNKGLWQVRSGLTQEGPPASYAHQGKEQPVARGLRVPTCNAPLAKTEAALHKLAHPAAHIQEVPGPFVEVDALRVCTQDVQQLVLEGPTGEDGDDVCRRPALLQALRQPNRDEGRGSRGNLNVRAGTCLTLAQASSSWSGPTRYPHQCTSLSKSTRIFCTSKQTAGRGKGTSSWATMRSRS